MLRNSSPSGKSYDPQTAPITHPEQPEAMNRFRSKTLVLILFSVAVLGQRASALPFDQAHMVAAPFETTRLETFPIDGPAPWLFVDLPTLGSFFTVVASDWFSAGQAGARFASVVPGQQNLDQFWLAPSEAAWAAARAAGRWTIEVTYQLVGIQFAENGGIGVGISEGGGETTVSFDVTAIPEPGTALLLGMGLSGLGATRHRARGQAAVRAADIARSKARA